MRARLRLWLWLLTAACARISAGQGNSSAAALPIRCVDDDLQPPTYGKLQARQANCSASRWLLVDGPGGGVGLGASFAEAAIAFRLALRTGRLFAMVRTEPRKNNFYLHACGLPSIFECDFEPYTACALPAVADAARMRPSEFRQGSEEGTLPDVVKLEWAPKKETEASRLGLSRQIFGGALAFEALPSSAAATLQYLVRPNAALAAHVRAALVASGAAEIDPERTISLPIRGSDKCGSESECPSFEDYMRICAEIRRGDPRVDTIIMTSEDAAYVAAAKAYGGGWRFVFNEHDVLQGTGGNIRSGYDTVLRGVAPEDVMRSMMASLYLQMRGSYLVLMCHSNFHRLLSHLALLGCSHAMAPQVVCVGKQVGLGISQDKFMNGRPQRAA